MIHDMRRFLVLLAGLGLVLLSTAAAAQAQDDPISATVDRTALTTDEILTLTVSVNGAGGALSDPRLPSLDGFAVLSRSSSTEVSIVNGDMAFSQLYIYFLQPNRAGELIIEPITIDIGGQVYQTAPIAIQVTQGTGQTRPTLPNAPGMQGVPSLGGLSPGSGSAEPTLPAPENLTGQEFYVEALVDKTSPYQGEQVIYTFRFYQGASLSGEPDYREPTFTGFWHEQQSSQQTFITEAAGRTYYVTELKTVLFPTVTGELTIEAAALEIPGGFFDVARTLVTRPITLTVRPLPPNPPAGFQGAVGQYTLQAMADTTTSQVNGAVTLQITQSGAGNLNTLGDLSWDVGPGWRPFAPSINSSTSFDNDRLQTTRIYEQVLVPTEPGTLTIPPVRFVYFDPAAEQYQTVETQPIAVEVAADATATDANAAAANGQAVAALDALRPLKPAPSGWNESGRGLAERPLYWLLWAMPPVLLGVAAAGGFVHRRREAAAPARRQQAAAREALSRLGVARSGDEAAYESGSRVLNDYLATRLGRPVAGMTDAALVGFLREVGLPDDIAGEVAACRRGLDLARFAPAAAGAPVDQGLLDTVEATIRAVEDVLNRGTDER